VVSAQSATVLSRTRIGNNVEGITHVTSGPLAGQLAIVDGWDVRLVRLSHGHSPKAPLDEVSLHFSTADLDLPDSPRAIAWVDSQRAFVFQASYPDHIVYTNEDGELLSRHDVTYPAGVAPPTWTDGMAYIPLGAPFYPDHLVRPGWSDSEGATVEILDLDGNVVDVITPPDPIRWEYIVGIAYRDERILLTTILDGLGLSFPLYVFDPVTLLIEDTLPSGGLIEGLAPLPDGRVAAGDYRGTISVFDHEIAPTGYIVDFAIPPGVSNPNRLAWNAAGEEYLIFGADNEITGVPTDLSSRRTALPLPGAGGYGPFDYLPDLHRIGFVYRESPSVLRWFDLASGTELPEALDLYPIASSWIRDVTYIPSTHQLAVRFGRRENLARLHIVNLDGSLARVVDLAATLGVTSPGAVNYLDGDLLAVRVDNDLSITDLYGMQRALVQDLGFFPGDVTRITSGPNAGALAAVAGQPSELVVFTLDALPPLPRPTEVAEERIGNNMEDTTYVASGPHAGQVVAIDYYDVVATEDGREVLFHVADLGMQMSPRGIAWVESLEQFVYQEWETSKDLFFSDAYGNAMGRRPMTYPTADHADGVDGLDYIPPTASFYPDHLARSAYRYSGNVASIEIVDLDGQLVHEIFPPEPVASGYIVGIAYREPGEFVVATLPEKRGSHLFLLDAATGAILSGPVVSELSHEGPAALPDGRIAAGEYGGRILMFDAALGRLPDQDFDVQIGVPFPLPRNIAWSSLGDEYLIESGLENRVYALGPDLAVRRSIADLAPFGWPAIDFMPDQSRLLVVDRHYPVLAQFIDLLTGEVLPETIDLKTVVLAGTRGAVYIPATGEIAVQFGRPENAALVHVLGPDGQLARIIDLGQKAGVDTAFGLTYLHASDAASPGELLFRVPGRFLVTDLAGNPRRAYDATAMPPVYDVTEIFSGPETGGLAGVVAEPSSFVRFELPR
jgi:hypothetical protein